MILCPKCGTRTNVYDSRISFEGSTRRKRLCPSCAYRFATIEVLDEGRPLVTTRVPKERKEVKRKPTAKKKKTVAIKKPVEKSTKRKDDDADYYESSLDEDFYDVARELGIGGLDEYE